MTSWSWNVPEIWKLWSTSQLLYYKKKKSRSCNIYKNAYFIFWLDWEYGMCIYIYIYHKYIKLLFLWQKRSSWHKMERENNVLKLNCIYIYMLNFSNLIKIRSSNHPCSQSYHITTCLVYQNRLTNPKFCMQVIGNDM